jgi:predicted naringenin-chalcone synthase
MSIRSATDALSQTPFHPTEVTHLVFGTNTPSIQTPTLDVYITHALHLPLTVQRINVDGMGCLTGFRLTSICRALALENEKNVVLLIVADLRSALVHQMDPFVEGIPLDKSNLSKAAFYRDGGGAAVFSCRQKEPSASMIVNLRVLSHKSLLISRETTEYVTMKEFNNGTMRHTLDPCVTEAIGQGLSRTPWIHELLREHGLLNHQRCLFAVHPGSLKILSVAQQVLSLSDEQLCGTRYVLETYGSVSGASNLVILDHLVRIRNGSLKLTNDQMQRAKIPTNLMEYTHIVGLAFGPGIAIECVLYEI